MGFGKTSMSLKNKTAIITGASRGLGYFIAKCFWEAGANLILVARSQDKLMQLQNELKKTNLDQTIKIIVTDLSNPKLVLSLVEAIEQLEIHILVNNAALQGPIGAVWENDWQAWQDALQVNLLTPIALCRAVIPQMIQVNYGKIINISGGGATNARPQFSSYAVAKTALVRFSETLAQELKNYFISVNCIAPGMMNTDMLTEIVNAGAMKAGSAEFEQAKNKKGTGHYIEENAAELCRFLASAESDGLTGKLISATWDPWKELHRYVDELKNSDIYTLRRITPEDRGKKWVGEK